MEKFQRKTVVKAEQIVSKEADLSWGDLSSLMEKLSHPDYSGYGIIGGVARALAFKIYNPQARDADLPIRDIDLCRLTEANSELADNLAREFSPDDYEHGHGVQEIESVVDYMNSRDFTMNQVIFINGELIASKQAINDIRRGIIRPCENRIKLDEHEYWDEYNEEYDTYFIEGVNYETSTRLALKDVLQKTVLQEYLPSIKIEKGIYNNDFDFGECSDSSGRSAFNLALNLQKALEYSEKVAEKFLAEIINSEIFNGDLGILIDENNFTKSPRDVMNYLNDNIMHYPFEYRGKALEYYFTDTNDLEYEEEMLSLGVDGELMQLPKRQSFGRQKRKR